MTEKTLLPRGVPMPREQTGNEFPPSPSSGEAGDGLPVAVRQGHLTLMHYSMPPERPVSPPPSGFRRHTRRRVAPCWYDCGVATLLLASAAAALISLFTLS